jgi:hypothetical protein
VRHAVRWLIPWGCLFLLTGTLAHTADQSLGHAWPDQSAIRVAAPAETGMRWILLSSADQQGQARSTTCLMPVDRVAADVLEVRSVDFDATASELCVNTQPRE